MRVLFENFTEDQAQTVAVVLSAAGIEFDVIRGSRGWNVRVGLQDRERAREAIASYLSENEEDPKKDAAPADDHPRTLAGIPVALMLLAVHVWITMSGDQGALWARFGASAEAILNGQYYRAVTALALHADWVHLAGNMVGIALFGTAVCAVAGWGLGGLIILMSGTAGNLLNALFYRQDHLWIGASTAVFGAVGFLAMYQFLRKYREPGRRFRVWVPLGGGLALLGMLGTAPHVDLSAHLFGFGSGILSATGYGLILQKQASTRYQIVGLFMTAGILLVCWLAGAGG